MTLLAALSALLLPAPTQSAPHLSMPAAHRAEPARPFAAGVASWYEQGTITASGERFDPDAMTCALPRRFKRAYMGRRILVVDQAPPYRECVVRVNDVGPADWTRRVVDLSRGARRLVMPGAGLCRVELYLVRGGQ